jgi:GNAT superfamily N-acetyltransferase
MVNSIASGIIRLDMGEWEIFGKGPRKDREYKCVTKFWDLYVRLYHATAYAYESNGKLVSFLAIAYNKLPKGEWGKYINSYLVYTLPEQRCQGYATYLHHHIEAEAMSRGYARTQSLIKTYAGFRFHLALGHTFWGLNTRGEMRCDSPLNRQALQPRGVPPAARDAKDAHPLTVPELTDILTTNPLYHQARPDIEALFRTQPLGYDPSAYRPTETLC